MFKLYAAIQKEILLLLNDRGGLLLMFVMPVLLVYLMTAVQHATTEVGGQKKIHVLVQNKDKGLYGQRLCDVLDSMGIFKIDTVHSNLKQSLKEEDASFAIAISSGFTRGLSDKAALLSSTLMQDMGIGDSLSPAPNIQNALGLYYDPVLQPGITRSIHNVVQSALIQLESNLMMEQICSELELTETAAKLKNVMSQNRVNVDLVAAMNNTKTSRPSSSQHNVPAWTIFAMFFMVTSLGNSIVGERLNGSFVRLKTMPSSFMIILVTKLLTYVLLAILQVAFIFSLASLSFPLLGLPVLQFPFSLWLIIPVAFCCALSAVSYALLVGVFARTQEQVNAFGAVSVVLMGAIGGIWVPAFLLPDFMQFIANFSPLHWCLDAFYILFLQGGDLMAISVPMASMLLFSLACMIVSYLSLRNQGFLR